MSATLVVHGGTVYDGSGAEGRPADVVLDGDRVAAVDACPGEHDAPVLDATGLAVAPGFVNVLSHAYFSVQQDPRGLSDLYQGVTTLVFGEGVSIGPFTPATRELVEPSLEPSLQLDHPPLAWERLSEFLAYLDGRGVAQNVASFVGAHNLRMLGAGADDRPMTDAELSCVRGVLDEELADGALGLASALIYPPGCFASTDELVALCEVVAGHDGLYISHMRSEGDRFLEALDELVEIGARARVRAEVFHLKAAGPDNWPKMAAAVERIERARASGQQVTADVYPYLAGQTSLAAAIPPPFHAGGAAKLAERLRDPAERERMRAGITTPSDSWENLYLAAGGADGVLLLPDPLGKATEYRGLTLQQAADRRGTDPAEAVLDLVTLDPSISAAYFMMDEDCLRTALRQPWVSVGSDSPTFATEPPSAAPPPPAHRRAPRGSSLADIPAHPRGYGAFARVLGRYARDEALLSLAEAVRRMTSLPAATLGLPGRGLLAPGQHADIVVFDPATVADRATYEDPHRYAAGVRHVVVNGGVALRDGAPTGELPGRHLRRGSRTQPPT